MQGKQGVFVAGGRAHVLWAVIGALARDETTIDFARIQAGGIEIFEVDIVLAVARTAGS